MNKRAQPRLRKPFFILAAGALFVFTSAGMAAAKAWRGIAPLASTRADVERLLGQPARKGDGWHYYDLRNEAAVFWFGDGKCDPWGLKWNVPAGTVTRISVAPKRRLKVSTLLATKAVGTKSAGAAYAVHHDRRAGLTVEAHDGFVAAATYEPGSADSARRCPASEKLTHFPHYHPFDQYGRLPREDEWARLDIYANALAESPLLRGVIVAYGGRRGPRGEARARGARAINYLVRVRGVEPWRVTAIDGGRREEPANSLSLFMIGSEVLDFEVAPAILSGEATADEPAGRKHRLGRRAARREDERSNE